MCEEFMQNKSNLVPNEARTPEKRRENARKAGKASGEARRKKKEFREVLEELLVLPSAELEGMTNLEAVCVSMLKKAQGGNVYAALFVRDTVGQKPTDKVAQSGAITIGWDDEISKAIMEARERREAVGVPVDLPPARLPGEFNKAAAKPDNRIIYSEPKPKAEHKPKVEPFTYEGPETNAFRPTDRAKRLQRYVQESARPGGFGAGYKSWAEDENLD